MLDFSNELPEFDFTLNLAESNLNKLNFDKTDHYFSVFDAVPPLISGEIILITLFGEIKLLNSTIGKYGNSLELYDFSLKGI